MPCCGVLGCESLDEIRTSLRESGRSLPCFPFETHRESLQTAAELAASLKRQVTVAKLAHNVGRRASSLASAGNGEPRIAETTETDAGHRSLKPLQAQFSLRFFDIRRRLCFRYWIRHRNDKVVGGAQDL